MVYTMVEEKFPKKPGYGNILEVCRKEFRNFKKDNGNTLIQHFNSRIERLAEIGLPNKLLIAQKENLENVRKLINDRKEDIAFSIFFRTFPSCLPHRSRRL
ncbi:MAG: hypothetical protein ACFE8C_00070 [Promethearchaeota archaeon]